jgi:UDP-N-acetylmuramate: L-alanyl-gamma-D-glutamyl-meso-diaminopimelate ligase
MRVHFIAIGGAAMHNLAIALYKKGYIVTGSDDEIFEPSKGRLANAGLLPKEYGWYPEKISVALDAIILGMHAREDNPELLEAQRKGLRIFSYPEFLYEQTKNKTRVVIGGSHGKTTITSMIMHVLKENKISFDYMVGSQIEGFETMVSLQEETKIAVFEGDEYLSSPIDCRPKFHLYNPHIGLINGIAWDHINVFPTYEIYKEQFEIFINKIEKSGALYFNGTDSETVEIVKKNARKDIEIEEYKEHSNKVINGTCYLAQEGTADIPLKIFGNHNMQNLSGAKAICNKLGISDNSFYSAIASFSGSQKRLQKLHEDENTVVYLDFAHAPSKVKATVEAVKQQYPEHSIIACLELHTFSSLNKQFIIDYKSTMDLPDEAIVFYNPEVVKLKKLPEIGPNEIKEAFSRQDLKVVTNKKELIKSIRIKQLKKRRVYLFMSSGNFGGMQKDEMNQFAEVK